MIRTYYCAACRQTHAVPGYEVPERESVGDFLKALVVLVLMMVAGYTLVLWAAAATLEAMR